TERPMPRALIAAALLGLGLLAPAAATAQTPCGGGFPAFVDGLKAEAMGRGIPREAVEGFFRSVRQDQSVLQRDRAQGFFTRPFIEFSRQLISQNRLDRGHQMAQ